MKNSFSWSLQIPPEVKTEYTGTKLGKFYLDPQVKLDVQLESERIFNSLYGLPMTRNVSASGGISYIAASVLGAEIEFPEDDPPELRARRLKSIEESYLLEIRNLHKSGLVPMVLEHYKYMKEVTKDTDITVNLDIGAQGPLTTAVILRGTDMFLDLILYPKESKILLDKCTEANLAILKLVEEVTGEGIVTVGIGDDYAGMISPEMYLEFSYPHLTKIFKQFEGKERFLHCETLKKGHLKYLDMMGINWYDPGVNNDLSARDILEETNVSFTYNLFTVRDMLNGNPELVRNTFRKIIEDGAPAITAEICRGTPKENIMEYLKIAREYEEICS